MAKKSKKKSKKDYVDLDNITKESTSLISKLFRPLKILIKIHLKVAARELKKDVKRYVSGIIGLIVGISFLIGFLIMLNITIVFLFEGLLYVKIIKNSWSWLFSIISTAGLNLILALLMFLSSIRKFNKPFMEDTKKIIKESIEELKED